MWKTSRSIWKNTHSDSRSMIDGQPYKLRLRTGEGTVLEPVEILTDQEIERQANIGAFVETGISLLLSSIEDYQELVEKEGYKDKNEIWDQLMFVEGCLRELEDHLSKGEI